MQLAKSYLLQTIRTLMNGPTHHMILKVQNIEKMYNATLSLNAQLWIIEEMHCIQSDHMVNINVLQLNKSWWLRFFIKLYLLCEACEKASINFLS